MTAVERFRLRTKPFVRGQDDAAVAQLQHLALPLDPVVESVAHVPGGVRVVRSSAGAGRDQATSP